MKRPTGYLKLPRVQDCIKYIESCGWHFEYHSTQRYVFGNNNKAQTIAFTLHELRDAVINGW